MFKRKVFGLMALLSSFSVHSATLDTLKSVPASQYDFGKLQLELTAYLLTEKMQDERILDTRFRLNKFSVEEKENELLLVGSLLGKTKEVQQEQCSALLDNLTQSGFFSDLPRAIWPSLPDKEYAGLRDEVRLSIKLISKDNKNFYVQC